MMAICRQLCKYDNVCHYDKISDTGECTYRLTIYSIVSALDCEE